MEGRFTHYFLWVYINTWFFEGGNLRQWQPIYYYFGDTESEAGTWSINENKLTIITSDGEAVGDYSISGNTLTLEFGETISGYTTFEVFVYTKQ